MTTMVGATASASKANPLVIDPLSYLPIFSMLSVHLLLFTGVCDYAPKTVA